MSSNPAKKSGRRKHPPLKEKDIGGVKYLRNIVELLKPLHNEKDCPNRDLHYDEYVAYILLYFFTPVLTSMRGLQQASEFEILKKKLHLGRFSLGSFSEASRVFDPELLHPIIEELSERVGVIATDERLSVLDLALTAVDGTLLHAMPKMAWALWLDDRHRAAKMHLEYSITKGVPAAATITNANANERTILKENLSPGKLYVLDAGYASYAFMDNIISAQSSFVVRVHENAVYQMLEERPISNSAKQAGITKDFIVHLGTPGRSSLENRPIRLVEIQVKGDPTRPLPTVGRVSSKKTFRTKSGDYTLLLATDRLDLDVELVADIYRYRWQIELFFRWFKKVLQADKPLALTQNGLTIIMYCALIASLLVVLWTGRTPTKRTFEMICFYFMGWVSEEGLAAHIARLQPAID